MCKMYNVLKIINFRLTTSFYGASNTTSQAVGTENILISDHCVCFEAELSQFFSVNTLIDSFC